MGLGSSDDVRGGSEGAVRVRRGCRDGSGPTPVPPLFGVVLPILALDGVGPGESPLSQC